MIEVDGLTVSFDDVTAVRDVSLSIESGEFVTIVGPSGCGKTTLLRAIGGLLEGTSGRGAREERAVVDGRVEIDGRDPAAARSDADIGFVFQQHTLFPWKTALENVTFLRRVAGLSRRTDDARELLAAVGLDDAGERYPSALSGGMKQRVAIARALHLGADVLLMDEPFGELDEITRDRLSVELREIWRRERKTILFVTHSVPEAVMLADRCLLVDGPPGRLVESFEIDLPRPRDERVFESAAYGRQVARVRSALHGTTSGRGGDADGERVRTRDGS